MQRLHATRMDPRDWFAGVDPNDILRVGVDSEEVELLQEALAAAGYDVAIDGDFGPATQQALMDYQGDHGIQRLGEPTGAADIATRNSLAAYSYAAFDPDQPIGVPPAESWRRLHPVEPQLAVPRIQTVTTQTVNGQEPPALWLDGQMLTPDPFAIPPGMWFDPTPMLQQSAHPVPVPRPQPPEGPYTVDHPPPWSYRPEPQSSPNAPAQSSYAPGGGIGSLFYGGIANAMAGPLNGGGPFGWGVMPPGVGGGLVGGLGYGSVPDYLTPAFFNAAVVPPVPGPLAVGMADETGPSWTTEDEKAEALAEAEERRQEREEEKAREREEREREREEEELRRAEKEALEAARSGGSKARAGQGGSSAKRGFGSSSSTNSRRTTLPSDDLSTEDWIAARNDQVHSRSSRAGRTSRR